MVVVRLVVDWLAEMPSTDEAAWLFPDPAEIPAVKVGVTVA